MAYSDMKTSSKDEKASLLATPPPDVTGDKKDIQVTEKAVEDSDAATEKAVQRSATQKSLEAARIRRMKKPRPLDRFVKLCVDQSVVVRGILIVILTSIPFLTFLAVALVLPKQYVGEAALNVSLLRLAKWLLVCWGSFLGLLYCGHIFAAGAEYVCDLSTGLYRFRSLAKEMCVRLTLLIWAGVGYAIMPSLFRHLRTPHEHKLGSDWVLKLQRAFVFLVIAFAIIFVQGVLLQLINIQYIEGFVGPRTAKASYELDIIRDLNHLVKPHKTERSTKLAKLLRKLFMPSDSRDLYQIIARGGGDEEVWNEYATKIWCTISNGQKSLTCADICQQLVYMNRNPEIGRELFIQLDESIDDEVTEEEVTALVHRIGVRLNRRSQAMQGIKKLMTKLEIVLSIVMLVLIIFVYGQCPSGVTYIDRQLTFCSTILRTKSKQKHWCTLDRSSRPCFCSWWISLRVCQLDCLLFRQASV